MVISWCCSDVCRHHWLAVVVMLLVEKDQAEKVKVQEELQQHLAEAQADVRTHNTLYS